jgi:tetratricopeptide (TPR) repeat protein
VVAALAVVSVRRNEDYRTELAIYQDTVDKRPGNARAHVNLGEALFEAGQPAQATEQYQRALALDPNCYAAHNNLGLMLVRSGKNREAVHHLRQALRSAPRFAPAHIHLGLALASDGKPSEAIACYRRAIELDADLVEAYYNLANALVDLEQPRQAIAYYEQALRLDPGHAKTHSNLAWVLATARREDGGDPARAVSLAERVCGLEGNDPPVCLDVLAVAYASAGRYPEAVRAAERAMELASVGGRASLAQRIGTRLGLYRNRQPYRESFGTPVPSGG